MSRTYIIYSENQIYSPQCWSVKHTKRFETLDEAVRFNEFDKYGSRSCWYKFEYDELYAKIKLRFPKFMSDPKNEKHCIIKTRGVDLTIGTTEVEEELYIICGKWEYWVYVDKKEISNNGRRGFQKVSNGTPRLVLPQYWTLLDVINEIRRLKCEVEENGYLE